MEKRIIIFDVETNGTKSTDSVLSISALKIGVDIKNNKMYEIERYNRFYYLNEGELPNESAIKVNGLTSEEITKRRGDLTYPMTFLEDIDSFYEFCKDTKRFVAHNIKFDRSFIPFVLEKQFDTMIENYDIVNAMGVNGKKYPKLMECAKFYKIPLDEDNLHESMYDVLTTARVLYVMYTKKHIKLLEFIEGD